MMENGNSEINVYVLGPNGQRITDLQEQKVLVQSLEEEVGHPVRIKVGTRGPDTELLVATSIEKCGRGRPRVLYDVTLALKMLDICIFKVFSSRSVSVCSVKFIDISDALTALVSIHCSENHCLLHFRLTSEGTVIMIKVGRSTGFCSWTHKSLR